MSHFITTGLPSTRALLKGKEALIPLVFSSYRMFPGFCSDGQKVIPLALFWVSLAYRQARVAVPTLGAAVLTVSELERERLHT